MKNLQCAWQLLLQSANPGPTTRSARSKLVWQVRTRPQRRHLGNRGGPSSTSPRRSRGTEFCARDRHSANEDGWIGAEASNQVRSGGVLGVVGGRVGHDQAEEPTGRRRGGEGPWKVSCRAHKEVVWMRCRHPSRPRRFLVETILARTSRWQEAHLRTPQESQESGNTAGSIGRLPFSDSYFRKTTMLSVRPAASRAHLRSHSGLNAGAALAFAPTAPEYVIPTHLERLQLPLPVDEAVCSGCHAPLDPLGRHRAACARTGRLKKRATPIERMLVRVCREGGARVRYNAFLRDMNVGVRASDERRIEVLAQDLPCFGGAQLAIDITLRGVLSSSGEPHSNAADVDVLCWRVLGLIKRRRTPNC